MGRFMVRCVGALALLAGVATVSSTASAASSNGTATGTPIKIGWLSDETGSIAPVPGNTQVGAEAFAHAINKEGGYRGHPLEVVNADDQSSPSGVETGTQLLISDGVLAIMPASPYFFVGAPIAHQAGMPVVGVAEDGQEWYEQPNTNMFSLQGEADPTRNGIADIPTATFFKSLGIKKVGGLAIGASAASKGSIETLATALQDQGLSMPFEDLSMPYTPFDVTPLVLQLKNSGVQAAVCSCGTATLVSIATGLKQAGVDLKVLSFGEADNSIFSSAANTAAVQGVYFTSELPPPTSQATQLFEQRLHAVDPQYKIGTVANYEVVMGYDSAAMVYKGLELTGSANPTQQSFMSHLRTLTNYTADGLYPQPMSYNHFGVNYPEYCRWFTQAQGSKITWLDGGKSFCLRVPSNLS